MRSCLCCGRLVQIIPPSVALTEEVVDHLLSALVVCKDCEAEVLKAIGGDALLSIED